MIINNEALTNYYVILSLMLIFKLIFNIQRVYFYKKTLSSRDTLLKNELTLTVQIQIVFSFMILLSSIILSLQYDIIGPPIMGSLIILIDQPFLHQKLITDGKYQYLFSCKCITYFLGFYLFCFLFALIFSLVFTVFPHILKWIFMVFAASLLPTIMYNFKDNLKPLFQSMRILNDGAYFAYLVHLFGAGEGIYEYQSDTTFLTAYFIVNFVLIFVQQIQRQQGGRVFQCLMPSLVAQNQILKYYHHVKLSPLISKEVIQYEKAGDGEDIRAIRGFMKKLIEDKENNLECTICLDTIFSFTDIRLVEKDYYKFTFEFHIMAQTRCKHTFHISCINLWLNQHKNCPYCRANLDLEHLEGVDPLQAENILQQLEIPLQQFENVPQPEQIIVQLAQNDNFQQDQQQQNNQQQNAEVLPIMEVDLLPEEEHPLHGQEIVNPNNYQINSQAMIRSHNSSLEQNRSVN